MKRIRDKGKRMFNLLIKSGGKYKEVILWYTKKIISTETNPLAFSYTTLIPIWKKGVFTGSEHDEICTHKDMGG